MCRLIALSADQKLGTGHKFVFSQMLCNSAAKGNDDGAGVVNIGIDPDEYGGNYYKEPVSSELMVLTAKYREVLSQPTNILVGHTRLASIRFRSTTGYTVGETHPHIFQFDKGWGWLMHNGNFRTLNPPPTTVGITDSAMFAQKLGETIGNSSRLEVSHIEHTLLESGSCEYSLLIGSSTSEEVFVVRGNRNLSTLETNYGLLLNTEEEVLKDLWASLWPLPIFGQEEIKIGVPQPLKEWTIYSLSKGVISPILDISYLKEINDTNPFPTGTYTAQNMVTYTPSRTTNPTNGGEIIMGNSDVNKPVGVIFRERTNEFVIEITELDYRSLLLGLTEWEINIMFYEAFGPVANTKATCWFSYQLHQLRKMNELLRWISSREEYKPTQYKKSIWKVFCENHPQNPYLAVKERIPTFGVPYFINNHSEFTTLESMLGD